MPDGPQLPCRDCRSSRCHPGAAAWCWALAAQNRRKVRPQPWRQPGPPPWRPDGTLRRDWQVKRVRRWLRRPRTRPAGGPDHCSAHNAAGAAAPGPPHHTERFVQPASRKSTRSRIISDRQVHHLRDATHSASPVPPKQLYEPPYRSQTTLHTQDPSILPGRVLTQVQTQVPVQAAAASRQVFPQEGPVGF